MGGEGIEGSIDRGDVAFDGTIRGDHLLLTLGRRVVRFTAGTEPVDPFDLDAVEAVCTEDELPDGPSVLASGQLLVVEVAEHLRLAPAVAGLISTLSHLARLGLDTTLGSDLVAPGWDGRLALELFNAAPYPLVLRPGMPLAKVALLPVDPSGVGAGSAHYGSGALISRYAVEFERTDV